MAPLQAGGKRKRGRSSFAPLGLPQAGRPSDASRELPQAGVKTKRGRPTNASRALSLASPRPKPSDGEPKRKKGRLSLTEKPLRSQHRADEEPMSQSSSSRHQQQPQKRAKPGRPRFEPESSESRRHKAQAIEQDEESARSEPQRRGRKRKVQQSEPEEVSAEPASSGRRKRKAREVDVHQEPVQEEVSKKFQHLKPRTRHIPQAIIVSKWGAPSEQVRQQIRELFKLAKIPIITNRRDDARRHEAEIVLGTVIKRLEGRLPNMPFPPRTKDMHFDLEKVVERNRALENQLTPAQHSVDLLKAAIEKEELHLEADEKVLARLEQNARIEKSRIREQTVKTHPLLRLPKSFEGEGDGPEDIGLKHSKSVDSSIFENPDPDLAPLLDQLRNHIESMQANHIQVHGIHDAMKDARVALDDVLFRHASLRQYDSVFKS
ncbi:hypothetical protein K432DRAFT_384432 [Lepidopterella palustris CBS 459.81]|uniref:Kinetochore protein fta7 n=1 Tax=Lepidopterella palustris CBS 459.81 TaxID=1314670 RepID=A0A8E2E5K8_9PEZI|nr:hypothetical protein K432DRAFT_384432 [Lepidopterella palustris CBS 459.81]